MRLNCVRTNQSLGNLETEREEHGLLFRAVHNRRARGISKTRLIDRANHPGFTTVLTLRLPAPRFFGLYETEWKTWIARLEHSLVFYGIESVCARVR